MCGRYTQRQLIQKYMARLSQERQTEAPRDSGADVEHGAGLWTAQTYCLFTTAADGELVQMHDRKPLSLDTAAALAWLRDGTQTNTLISAAMKADSIQFHPVSKAVSNWRNDGPHLIEINSL
jgi:putative SOS response-associated peptidase YedK